MYPAFETEALDLVGGIVLPIILIYTDGACLNNGQANPRAGCAFAVRGPGVNLPGYNTSGIYSCRLELPILRPAIEPSCAL
jgi:hypothetical protein